MHHRNQDMCCCSHHERQFFTKEEKLKQLLEYKKWLDNESKGVTEVIEELKLK